MTSVRIPGVAMSNSKRTCIYCGGPTGRVRKGEHVVPRALGGTKTIKNVCSTCNNGVLSTLDEELATKSPLSIARMLSLEKATDRLWAISGDKQSGAIRYESKYDASRGTLVTYPQLILEQDGWTLTADDSDIQQIGIGEFQRMFFSCLTLRKKLINAPLKDTVDTDNYPPRIFSRRPLCKFEEGMNFHLGYATESDKDFARNCLSRIRESTRIDSPAERVFGSESSLEISCDQFVVARGLLKISVNLIAWFMGSDFETDEFTPAIRRIMDPRTCGLGLLKSVSFVQAGELDELAAQSKGHSFRFDFEPERKMWTCCASFFGGTIGAVMEFPGMRWRSNTVQVHVPLNNDDWNVEERSIWTPSPRPKRSWDQLERMINNFELTPQGGRVETTAHRDGDLLFQMTQNNSPK